MSIKRQRTLASEILLKGKGVHTGISVTATIKPAPVNHGYKFCRTDLEGKPVINAIVDNVSDTSRGTTLTEGGASVSTIEHMLAAFYGMNLDNILVELDGPEAPIMGGSSKVFVDAIIKAGIVEQDANRNYFEIKEKIVYSHEEDGVDLIIYPDDHLSVNVLIDYNSKILGNQYAVLNRKDDFAKEIASSRTFCFFHELEPLYNKGLIKGGDLDNAIVILEEDVSNDEIARITSLFHLPEIKDHTEGILNNTALRHPNEPARHKLLDLLGDMALVGQHIKGKIVATRPGHTANTNLARLVRQEIKKAKSGKSVPHYDPCAEPVANILDIRNFLPHRYPFLLVDKIIYKDDNTVVGIKNVTFNEHFFQGHFPAEPIMPGVLIIEAMAQVGGMLMMGSIEDPENYSTYFLKIDKVKFKQKVVPGDTLILKLEKADEGGRRGIFSMYGHAYVGDKVVAEGELVAAILKNE